jgi:succinate dehydrogenase/fumarate reductase flavoprotein subunit
MPTTLLSTDVLVLGSGLSGLRAAWAAKEQNQKLNVTVACLLKGPSGSSFTNRNNALGYQLLDTDDRKTTFVEEAMALGWPGFIDEKLVTILADESEPRFREMEELGLTFKRDTAGHLVRHPGCGSLEPRAVIFDDLHASFNRYSKKTTEYDCNIVTDLEILGIIVHKGIACGAWGRSTTTGRLTCIRSTSVIMALGGPAPLFHRHIAGAANPGLGYGIMADAGVTLANTAFHQFMWGRHDRSFVNPATLLAPGNVILRENGTSFSPTDQFGTPLTDLRTSRATHCPTFHDRPDTILDRTLMDNQWDDGFARIKDHSRTMEISLFAHAGNGGAVINENGETSIRNLFAIGECATGMHGANRMGGAMILATQVLGRRAGIEAANRSNTIPSIKKNDFNDICDSFAIPDQRDQETATVNTIRQGMQQFALFEKQVGIQEFRKWLKEQTQSRNRIIQLTALSALEASRPTIEETLRLEK